MKSLFAGAAALILSATAPLAGIDTPPRGVLDIAVLPCTFSGYAPPSDADMAEYRTQLNAGVDFWNLFGQTEMGVFRLRKTQFPWVEIQNDWVTATTADPQPPRNTEKDACRRAHADARSWDADIEIFLFHPRHDTYGSPGGGYMVVGTTTEGAAALGPSNENLGLNRRAVAHELGHALGLHHEMGHKIDPARGLVPDAYGDRYDMMGGNAPGMSPYSRERLGLYKFSEIVNAGHNAQKTVTLVDTNSAQEGKRLIRIPIDRADPNHYLAVEYNGKYEWIDHTHPRPAQLYIYEVTKPGQAFSPWGIGDVGDQVRSVLLYDTRQGTSLSDPIQAYDRDGLKVTILSQTGSEAVIEIVNPLADTCIEGYTWREATGPDDKVCVTLDRYLAVQQENDAAPRHTNADGSCEEGYVWREARGSSDKVCVTPESRAATREENYDKLDFRLTRYALGPNTCKDGHIWRRAHDRDWVCVTRNRYNAVQASNKAAPKATLHGSNRCKDGYVWRMSSLTDKVCVTPDERDRILRENANAADHLRYLP